MHAVATVIHAHAGTAKYFVAANDRSIWAMQINTKQIIFDFIVLDQRGVTGFADKNAGIDSVEILARIADHQTTHDDIGCHDGDHLAGSAAVDNSAGAAFKPDPRPLDERRPGMHAGSEHENITVAGCGERLFETPAAGFDVNGCRMGLGQTAGRDNEAGRCRQAYGCEPNRHQPFGLTSMRPRISIWRAWQNHWQ